MAVRYRYYIGSTEVFPINADLPKIKYERKVDSAIILEKTVEESFVFDTKGAFDFVAQEASNPIEELIFKIQQVCQEDFVEPVELLFTVAEGKWDNDKCRIEIKPRTRDEFEKDVPINIINAKSRYDPTANGLLTPGGFYGQTFYFEKILLLVAQKSNSKINSIVSDFFQINPINVSTDAIPGVDNKWTQMFFASLSDIQSPIPSNFATLEYITFRELFDDLNILFDVFWFIDDDDNLRLEHRSFYEGLQGLDLTQLKYALNLKSTDRYTYDLSNIPKIQELRIVGSQQYASLTYGWLSLINKNKNTVTKTTKKINTDMASIVFHGGSSSNDGLFLFATELIGGDPTMIEQLNAGSLFDGQNDALSPLYLMRYLHTYGRYAEKALFNSVTVYEDYPHSIAAGGFNSISVQPVKLQEEISFPICCGDEFDPTELVKTGMGLGHVEKASIDLKTSFMTLQLKYKVKEPYFNPTYLLGCHLWLRAWVGMITNGSPNFRVSQWTDYSGQNNHAVQSLPANQPFYSGVGLDAPFQGISFFDGPGPTYEYLTIPNFQACPGKRGTVFILFTAEVLTEKYLLVNDSGPTFFIANALGFILTDFDGPMPQFLYPKPGQPQRLITWRRFDDTQVDGRENSVDIPAYQNDPGPPVTVVNPKTIANVQPALGNMYIGHRPGFPLANELGSVVRIQEIIMYDRDLTDSEIEMVELYIAKGGYYKISNYIHL